MQKNNVDLICNIGELANLFNYGAGIEAFLRKVVSVVAWHMKAAVCSVYLFDERRKELHLVANQGLNPDLVGDLRLKLGEGITGLALKELRAIREADGSTNPNFKYIPGSNEERFKSFLAVPILRGITRVGVLVVQDTQVDYFDENDTKALKAITTQLASTIEYARLLLDLRGTSQERAAPPDEAKPLKFVKGIGASGGLVSAQTFSIGRLTSLDFSAGQPATAEAEGLVAFETALSRTEQQLQDLQREVEEWIEDAASLIFSAHLLMLKDDAFSGAMRDLIQRGTPARHAIAEVTMQFVRLFAASPNHSLREKVMDVKDLAHRLLRNLGTDADQAADYGGQIVIAEELLPSDIFKLRAEGAAGLILVGGSLHSHVSILARSLKLPTVLAQEPQLLELPERTHILMDADNGTILINPGPDVVRQFDETVAQRTKACRMAEAVNPDSRTRDGVPIFLMANINLLSDLNAAQKLHAAGIGLYRTEFPFIVRNDFPSEEEQYRIYKRVADCMPDQPVVFRTLDIGGDKALSYYPGSRENNPFLGLRAIRFSLRNPEIFKQQLRALLRAGAGREIRIMFPLIASVDEFTRAGELVQECAGELTREGVAHQPRPRLGVMVELPSAAEIAADLAREADFLSIGSNDLIQYLLAVDRTNDQVADLYTPCHPAVLRILKRIVDAALIHQKDVSLCGNLASDVHLLPFLLGIGLRRFSLEPILIPKVQRALAKLDTRQARRDAENMLNISRVKDLAAFVNERYALLDESTSDATAG